MKDGWRCRFKKCDLMTKNLQLARLGALATDCSAFSHRGCLAVADLDVAALEAEAHLPGDLLDANYADGLPAAAATLLGGLDILVNNAGVITRGLLLKQQMLIGIWR